ncbi:MAG TPA: hypothetical protein VN806_13090 [Caulobacteraceae bacterium]|nr:hypothetical protein [Caulobacteraceae bacterium]
MLLAAVAAMAVGVAGCGSSSSSDNGVAARSPTEIVAAAKAAADAASSVHVAGSIVSGGVPLTLDLSLAAGKGGQGRISQNGLSFEVIQLNGTAYISGSPAFYSHFAGPAAAQLLQGKWLKASATTGSLASLAPLTELRKLVDSAVATRGGTLTKGAKTTIEGQPAVAVTETAQKGVLYVATTGQPYPIEIAKSGDGGGKIVFGKWNQPVTLAAPKNSVDISELQARAHG